MLIRRQHGTSIERRISLILFFILLAVRVHSIAHDSLNCNETGNCEMPSHLILKLTKRDDHLAMRIADEHGMELKV